MAETRLRVALVSLEGVFTAVLEQSGAFVCICDSTILALMCAFARMSITPD